MSHSEIVEEMKKLTECEGRVGEPVDEIKSIFDKITAWKQSLGSD